MVSFFEMTELTLGGYMRKHERAAAFGGSDGQPYALGEETDDASAQGRFALRVHEIEPSPQQSRASGAGQQFAGFDEGTLRAIVGQDFAFLRTPQSDAVSVHGNAHGQFSETDVRLDFVRLDLIADNRRS